MPKKTENKQNKQEKPADTVKKQETIRAALKSFRDEKKKAELAKLTKQNRAALDRALKAGKEFRLSRLGRKDKDVQALIDHAKNPNSTASSASEKIKNLEKALADANADKDTLAGRIVELQKQLSGVPAASQEGDTGEPATTTAPSGELPLK